MVVERGVKVHVVNHCDDIQTISVEVRAVVYAVLT